MTPDAPAEAGPAAEVRPVDEAPAGTPSPAAGAPAGDALVVRAAILEWEGETFRARGGVEVEFGEQRLVADSAWGTVEELLLERGTWSRSSGEIRFERATIQLRTRSGEAVGVELRVGEATLRAAEVQVDGEESARTRDATLEPCACSDGKPAALRFVARRIDVIDAEVAIIRGGSVQFFRVPLVPVPWWRVPLNPKAFRLLIPEVGYGDIGVSARWHGRGGSGPWWIEGGPAFRQDRGLRAEVSTDGPLRTHGEIGWDWLDGAPRGAFTAEGGVAGNAGDLLRPPGWRRVGDDRSRGTGLGDRSAVDLTLLSDAAYADDYGVSYVDRGVPYRESRLTAQWRSLRFAGWLPDGDFEESELGGNGGRMTDLAVMRWRPEWASGGEAVAPSLALGVDRANGEALPSFALGLDARASHTWGLLHAEADLRSALPFRDAQADGTAAAVLGLDTDLGRVLAGRLGEDAYLAGRARVELPVWAEGFGGRWQWWPGVVSRGTWLPGTDGSAQEALAGGAGPSLRGETVLGSVVASGAVDATWDGGAWTPSLALDVSGDGVALRAFGNDEVQGGEVSAGRDLVVRLGGLHGPPSEPDPSDPTLSIPPTRDLWLAWTDVGVRVGRAVFGVGASLDPDAEADDAKRFEVGPAALALTGASARAGYDDGCTALLITAALSPDRELPDFGAQFTLRR